MGIVECGPKIKVNNKVDQNDVGKMNKKPLFNHNI